MANLPGGYPSLFLSGPLRPLLQQRCYNHEPVRGIGEGSVAPLTKPPFGVARKSSLIASDEAGSMLRGMRDG